MPEKSKFWYLRNINLFEVMDDSQLKAVEKMTNMNRIEKHHPIYFPAQPSKNIFFLKEGHVKLSHINEDGHEIILDILGPGEIFGELSITDEEERKETAQTLDEVLICTISKNDFEKLVLDYPPLNLQLTKWMGLRLRRIEEKLSDLAFKDVKNRVIDFLIKYAEDFGKIKHGSVHISSFLSHQEIAYLTATSRQTVTTILNELKSRGLIDFTRKSFVISNLEQLQQLNR